MGGESFFVWLLGVFNSIIKAEEIPAFLNYSDAELDGVMELLVKDFPNNGVVMMWGQLRSMNVIVIRQKVHDSLTRVSPLFAHYLPAYL